MPYCFVYSPAFKFSLNSFDTKNIGSLSLLSIKISLVIPSRLSSGPLNVKIPNPFINVAFPFW